MKRALILSLVIAAGAGAVVLATTPLSPDAKNTLTPVDQVPTKDQINGAFGNEQMALTNLTTIATDPDTTPDAISVRLRAIHALAKYCASSPCTAGDVAHQSVASVITMTRDASTGSDVLILRAGIETLGVMRVSSDVGSLQTLLDHPSRDIRAATARALRDLCNTQAIDKLRARYSVELTDQVKLAISEALRILSQCSANQ